MMFIYIITSAWNGNKHRHNIIGSNFQFTNEEFQQIVKEAEEKLENDETIYNSYFGKGHIIAHYLARNDNRFFEIYNIKEAIIHQ